MPEPFKNYLNPDMIAQMGNHLARANANFDADQFVQLATTGLEPLELKDRSNHIRAALTQMLNGDFQTSCATLVDALHPTTDRESGNETDELGIAGWPIMPMADYVATHGLPHHTCAMETLKELTKRFSSEFAVRPFFIDAPEATLKVFKTWAEDQNFHVRRLASEGSRPRLPWGLRLHAFVKDPSPILPILEALKDDDQEYVRRSVANNLNDIAKDHPDLVAKVAGRWLKGASKDRVRLVKHGCRSLIKAGHQPTLDVLGYGPAQITLSDFELSNPDVEMGGKLQFSATLASQSDAAQPLIIDYVIHHINANGETSPKVFKWKVAEIKGRQSLTLKKAHAIKPITTRVYRAGVHHLEIQVNGQVLGRLDFNLKL